MTEIMIKKPVAWWNKRVGFKAAIFFSTLGKLVIDLGTCSWRDAAKDTLEISKSICTTSSSWQDHAWLLILRATTNTVAKFAKECAELLHDTALKNCTEIEQRNAELSRETEAIFQGVEIEISQDLLERPERLKVNDAAKRALFHWLSGIGCAEAQAKGIVNRYTDEFVFALLEEWREGYEGYKAIADAIKTPFDAAQKRIEDWKLYNAFLCKLSSEPMFDETFPARQCYVELRACYECKPDEKTKSHEQNEISSRTACMLSDYLHEWLAKPDKDDPLRIVTGGPGCGKSTFSKMFAAKLASSNALKVLYIPLTSHFRVQTDLIDSIGHHLEVQGILGHNPLLSDARPAHLCVIFDGLDELPLSENTVNRFIEHVSSTLSTINESKQWLQVIITGREITISETQLNYLKAGSVLYMLPYLIPENEKLRYTKNSAALLEVDQRNEWWKLYGEAIGKHYLAIPDDIKGKDLDEITAEPLLNYLVALARRSGFDFKGTSNRNLIYDSLLSSVYKRAWEKGKQIEGVDQLSQDQFIRLMQEIAVAAWHGGEIRTTTLEAIEARCSHGKVKAALDKLKGHCPSNLIRLLAAFFFKDAGEDRSGLKTFQFTHKSFGEYLAARRIVWEIQDTYIHSDSFELLSKDHILSRWLRLCGPAPITHYILDFVEREILVELEAGKQIELWAEHLSAVFGYALRHGMPAEQCALPTFKVQYTYASNAEEALFCCLAKCGKVSGIQSNIDFPSIYSFSKFTSRVYGSKEYGPWAQIPSSLAGVNLSGQSLAWLNLCGSDFRVSDLSACEFDNSCLDDSDFSFSKLDDNSYHSVSCWFSSFDSAVIQNSRFIFSEIRHCSFDEAVMKNVDFQSSSLHQSSFVRAIIKDANFTNTDLRFCNFSGARLTGARFRGADISKANFRGADLRGAKLGGIVNYETAYFYKAKVEGTWLDGKVDTATPKTKPKGKHLQPPVSLSDD